MYRVLIVDDDNTVRYMLKRYKKWDSYGLSIVDEASDGKEALKKLASNHFDLLLTDIKMPGMDGIELLTELNILKWDICVIFLSTHSDFNYAKQGIRLGVFDYMTKPINDDVMGDTLKRVQMHLDFKSLQKNRVEEDKKQLAEGLKLYSPKNREKKIAVLLLSGSAEALKEAREAFGEVASVLGQDKFRIGRLIENMVSEISEEIYSVFPWLDKIEGESIKGSITSVQCLDEIETLFIGCVETMLKIIKKYELHQTDGIVRKTSAYVFDHVEENIKLEMIANELSVSRDYIGKLFKHKTGHNFHEYVTMVKMEHAKNLIRTGAYKNYEVSEKLGYSKPDYFARLFKDYTGYTPMEFRKMNK